MAGEAQLRGMWRAVAVMRSGSMLWIHGAHMGLVRATPDRPAELTADGGRRRSCVHASRPKMALLHSMPGSLNRSRAHLPEVSCRGNELIESDPARVYISDNGQVAVQVVFRGAAGAAKEHVL